VWPHSYNSHGKSLVNWEGEPWADPAVVPSLVQELALSQLRNLLAGVSQVSLALAVVAEESPEWPPEDVEEKP